MTNEQLVLGCLIMSKNAYLHFIKTGIFVEMFSENYRSLITELLEYRLENDSAMIPIQALKNVDVAIDLIEFAEHESPSMYAAYIDAFKQEYIGKQAKTLIKQAEFTSTGVVELCDNLTTLVQQTPDTDDTETIVDQTIEEVEKRHSKDYENPYRTGLMWYDQLGYFDPGSLVILGGKSGHGKSRFALNLTQRWLNGGKRVVYFSYEMTAPAVFLGLALITTNIGWNKARAQKGQILDEKEKGIVIQGIKYFRSKPIKVNEFAEALPEVDLAVKQFQADVFVIDTVNELISEDANYWVKLGRLASGYKRIAKKYRCVCVMLAQLGNYEVRPTNKEMLAESKRMKNPPDYMDFIHREEEANLFDCPPELLNILEVYRVKGRFVGTGKCILHFNAESGQMRDVTTEEAQKVKKYLVRGE